MGRFAVTEGTRGAALPQAGAAGLPGSGAAAARRPPGHVAACGDALPSVIAGESTRYPSASGKAVDDLR